MAKIVAVYINDIHMYEMYMYVHAYSNRNQIISNNLNTA